MELEMVLKLALKASALEELAMWPPLSTHYASCHSSGDAIAPTGAGPSLESMCGYLRPGLR
jgi:hypothetical protein